MLPIYFHQYTNKKLDKKADEIIEQFFLINEKNFSLVKYLMGQQKLLSLACCIANEASLILIDEAVAGIQPEYGNKIAMILKQLKKIGTTILVIEHNTDFIADVADKIFFMHNREISSF